MTRSSSQQKPVDAAAMVAEPRPPPNLHTAVAPTNQAAPQNRASARQDLVMWPRVNGLRAFGLGRPGEMRSRLNELVFSGQKRATAGLWRHEYEPEGEALEEPGERQVLLGDDGQPAAVVVVDRVEVHRFEDVPWEFALAEGEGFLSTADWREGHRSYYDLEGITVTDDDSVVCVWFSLTEG